jgi:hypothetical protein
LIDSYVIKYSLDNFDPNQNISQGRKGFNKAYINKNKVKLKVDTEKQPNNKDYFSELSEKNKDNTMIRHFITQDVLLGNVISTLYADNNWSDYYSNKPPVINRNWLAHGMYDYDDITKADCYKLIFILCLEIIVFTKEHNK